MYSHGICFVLNTLRVFELPFYFEPEFFTENFTDMTLDCQHGKKDKNVQGFFPLPNS